MPNTTSLSLLIPYINERYSNEVINVVKFIHDEQKQFEGYLREIFEYIHLVSSKSSSMIETFDILESANFICAFEVDNSKNNSALQFIDLLLWFIKKTYMDNVEIFESNEDLYSVLIEKAGIAYIHEEWLISDLNRMYKEVMDKEVDTEKITLAEEFIANLERENKLINDFS